MRKWLKTLRLKENLKQIEIAEQLNISQAYYNLIENGERKKDLDLSLTIKLAELFHISVEWIAEQEKKVAL